MSKWLFAAANALSDWWHDTDQSSFTDGAKAVLVAALGAVECDSEWCWPETDSRSARHSVGCHRGKALALLDYFGIGS